MVRKRFGLRTTRGVASGGRAVRAGDERKAAPRTDSDWVKALPSNVRFAISVDRHRARQSGSPGGGRRDRVGERGEYGFPQDDPNPRILREDAGIGTSDVRYPFDTRKSLWEFQLTSDLRVPRECGGKVAPGSRSSPWKIGARRPRSRASDLISVAFGERRSGAAGRDGHSPALRSASTSAIARERSSPRAAPSLSLVAAQRSLSLQNGQAGQLPPSG